MQQKERSYIRWSSLGRAKHIALWCNTEHLTLTSLVLYNRSFQTPGRIHEIQFCLVFGGWEQTKPSRMQSALASKEPGNKQLLPKSYIPISPCSVRLRLNIFTEERCLAEAEIPIHKNRHDSLKYTNDYKNTDDPATTACNPFSSKSV